MSDWKSNKLFLCKLNQTSLCLLILNVGVVSLLHDVNESVFVDLYFTDGSKSLLALLVSLK